MKFLSVTTMNQAIWDDYGKTMVETFIALWQDNLPLRVYTEDFTRPDCSKVQFVDLYDAAPWFKPWKKQYSSNPQFCGMFKGQYTYRTDAIKFSHKVAALGAATEMLDGANVLVWMDADMVTHEPVQRDWLASLFDSGQTLAWLARPPAYPECGFMMFRFPGAELIINNLLATYQSGKVFKYNETHDSYVIQKVVENLVAKGLVTTKSLAPTDRYYSHPFVNCELASRLDHFKGDRKLKRRSKQGDLKKKRTEPYWQIAR